jgi:DNA (cytosine-5)-methyltransferase 1
LKIASFFSGAGGLDKGFENAGFHVAYANEYDKSIWETFELNFPGTRLDKRSILEVEPSDVPDTDGFVGGPPCQSWSEAGARRGIDDQRGQLFLDYIRLLKAKKPKFFLAENVSGILHEIHSKAFNNILDDFREAGYDVFYELLNANNFEVPEDRKRVIIVGFRKDLKAEFSFPLPIKPQLTLRDAIGDLGEATASTDQAKPQVLDGGVPNHEFMLGSFSTIYMSRNRVRSWDEPSFTIQAGARHAPMHPGAPKMVKQNSDNFVFAPNEEDKYRRLSVRECARIQTFPDDFIFVYDKISTGYKMIGNAVPVKFAEHIARAIMKTLRSSEHHIRAKQTKKTQAKTVPLLIKS